MKECRSLWGATPALQEVSRSHTWEVWVWEGSSQSSAVTFLEHRAEEERGKPCCSPVTRGKGGKEANSSPTGMGQPGRDALRTACCGFAKVQSPWKMPENSHGVSTEEVH